jgi:uncharacterized coiled-coil DUF342 family protein
MTEKDYIQKIIRLDKEINELNLLIKTLREWIVEDSKEIKQLQEELDEYRNR